MQKIICRLGLYQICSESVHQHLKHGVHFTLFKCKKLNKSIFCCLEWKYLYILFLFGLWYNVLWLHIAKSLFKNVYLLVFTFPAWFTIIYILMLNNKHKKWNNGTFELMAKNKDLKLRNLNMSGMNFQRMLRYLYKLNYCTNLNNK